MARPKDLTTTSYALLGLLAIKPWSAYELAGQMKRGFPWFWPRAERAIYAEPKNLEAHGLARSSVEHHGRRARAVYEITPAGREALRRWLGEPSAPPRFEAESLVRLTFVEHGSPDDVAPALDALRAAAAEIEAIVATVSGEYGAGRGPFVERLPQVALGGSFIAALATMLHDYADWAEAFWDECQAGDAEAASLARLAELHAAADRQP